jgi:four helix bundle protein
MRRAAVSVPSNIAEGQAHYNKGEFLHHLRHSRGSLAELETQVLIAQRLTYIATGPAEDLLKRVDEVNRILAGLIKSLTSEG